MTEPHCPLCGLSGCVPFARDSNRVYLRCGQCRLIFVPPSGRLSPAEEKSHYDLHENDPEDAGYRRFLGRLFRPLQERLAPCSFGLDFGSGPGPTLSVMFEEAGHRMNIHDKFYAPDTRVLEQEYDFITATEVVEHLAAPGAVLDQLWALLRPGGWLGIMTKLARDAAAFSGWHYKNDPTHIAFFSRDTFAWLGRHWGAVPEFIGDDVILFRK